MTDKFIISDISFNYPQEKEILEADNLRVKTYLPLEQKLNLIQRVMNMCAGNGTFCNPVQVNVITDLEIVMTYSNIEINQEVLSEDVYKVYDYLKISGIMDSVLTNVNENELNYIRSACWETSEKLTQFNNSVAGMLSRMSESAELNNLKLDEMLEKIKDPSVKEFLEKFSAANIS